MAVHGKSGPKPYPVLASEEHASVSIDAAEVPGVGIVLKVGIPAEQITGLLQPFAGRPRAVLTALLGGASVGMAATKAGVSLDTVAAWRKRYPEFAAAEQQAAQWGFASTYEAELYDRALDRADRGSMRALELVVKARDAAYRDKVQGQIDVVHRAIAAEQAITAGWQPTEDINPPPASA